VASPKTRLELTTCHDTAYGDSGAWVIHDGKLCGQIVGGKGHLPWAYMVPIRQILQEIQGAFGTDKISLPTSAIDFPTRLMLQEQIYPAANLSAHPYSMILSRIKRESSSAFKTARSDPSSSALGGTTVDGIDQVSTLRYMTPAWHASKASDPRSQTEPEGSIFPHTLRQKPLWLSGAMPHLPTIDEDVTQPWQSLDITQRRKRLWWNKSVFFIKAFITATVLALRFEFGLIFVGSKIITTYHRVQQPRFQPSLQYCG
jgi:hypothetical protein